MTRTRYTFSQRLLHWLIALLVFGLLAVGFTLWGLGYEGTVKLFGEAQTNQLYTLHKSFGILLFLLMVLRLVLRRMAPPPAYDPPLGIFERVLGGGIHLLMYLILLAMPIGGWLATASSGYPVQFFQWELPGLVPENKALGEQLFQLHGIAGLVLLGLVLVHIAAGVKHWKLKDGIMDRISLP